MAPRLVALMLSTSLLLLGGCAGEDSTDLSPQAQSASTQTRARECDSVEGSTIDVKHEPDWRPHATYRPWTDRDGCLLRIDVLAERAGPDHCGWQEASVIIAGRPIGSRYTEQADAVEYVKDPNEAFGLRDLAEAFDPNASLPEDAVDAGFRRAGLALWHEPGDQSAVWIVAPDRVERWPAGTPPVCQ
jgi:hypothetical protein